jgi:hypothetical protein
VDELPELDEIYLANPKPKPAAASEPKTPPQNKLTDSPAGSAVVASSTSDEPTQPPYEPSSWTPQSYQSPTQVTSAFKRRRTNDTDLTSFASVGQPSPVLSRFRRNPGFGDSSPTPGRDAIDSLLRAADFSEQGPDQSSLFQSPSKVHESPFAVSSPDDGGLWPHTNVQEACLMRYFIDELACWVFHQSGHWKAHADLQSSISVIQNAILPKLCLKELGTVPLCSTQFTLLRRDTCVVSMSTKLMA